MKKFNAMSLFCESVRPEANGQQTLVGVFSDSINVASVPGQLPMLAVYTRINFEIDESFSKLSTDVIAPDGTVISHGDLDMEIIETSRRDAASKGHPTFGLISTMTAFNFPIMMVGVFTVKVTVDNNTFLAGILGVQLVPDSV